MLNLAIQDDEGDKVSGAVVTFTKMDGTALGQSLYATESGGAPVVAHEADSQGMLVRFLDDRTRVKYAVNGGTPLIAQFDPDPADLVLRTDDDALLDGNTNLLYRDQANALDQYAGTAAHVLTIQPTTGGSSGDKALKIKNAAGSTVFEVAALGSGPWADLVGTWIDPTHGPLVISPTRNWNEFNDFVCGSSNITAAAVGQGHNSMQCTYATAAQPSDGFGGVTNIPDEVVANFDAFVVNTLASDFGAVAQNADTSTRAIEIQTMVFQNTGQRTCAAMTAGCHTAVLKVNTVENQLVGGSVTDQYGDCGIIIHNLPQPYTGFGTTIRANTGLLITGNPGWKQGIAFLSDTDSLLYAVDQNGDVYSGDLYPRPGGSFEVGNNTRRWTAGSFGALSISNGSAAGPTVTFVGAGSGNDGLFGSVSGGVLGVSIASVEKARFDANGVALAGNVRLALTSPAQITSNQNDYSPTGLASARILRLTSDAARDVTGLAAQPSGTVMSIINVGGFAITLKHESGSSAGANRFNFTGGADVALAVHQSIDVFYDGPGSRWKRLG